MSVDTQNLSKVKRDDFYRVMGVLGRYSIHAVLLIFGLLCLIPMIIILSASFTDEIALTRQGYGIIPAEFSTTAYQFIFDKPETILRAYGVTIFITGIGTPLAVLMMSLMAYPLSRADFKLRRAFSFYILFTMLFNGGLVPYYILMTQYLHLRNTLTALILPHLVGGYYIMILRSYFAGLPQELIEAARVDGAGEWRIFFEIVLPLSKPALATIGLFVALGYWNSWTSALYFIRDQNLYPLQYLLHSIMRNAAAMALEPQLGAVQLPLQTTRMAMAVLATGPAAILFLFFQKYLIRGITLGSFK
jgi:putative aldouronate transport system permease protein